MTLTQTNFLLSDTSTSIHPTLWSQQSSNDQTFKPTVKSRPFSNIDTLSRYMHNNINNNNNSEAKAWVPGTSNKLGDFDSD